MLQDGERTAERAFNTSLSWEAPGFQIPLKDRGAQIHDIREKFGFEQHWGSHGRDQREQERLRHRRPKLRGEAEARQHKMLDDTAGIIARIMEPQAPAALLESWHTAKAAQLSDAEESALVDNMIEVYEALPEGGAAGTALAAVLTKSLGRATLRDLTEKHAVRYKKARLQDFKTLLTGQEIVRETTRKSKPDTVVRNFVRWTLSGDNVVMTSWGKKRARLDGEKIEIPAVSRKRSKPTMWADYCETYQNKRLRLGRSSFYSAMKEITSGQQKNVRAIDYFVGELAHANRERLERLTRDHLGTEAQRLIAEMRAVFQYVKTSYPKRLRSSACPSHDVRFALGVGDDPGQQPVIDTQSAAIFAWFGKLRVQLPAAHRPLVDHAVEKVVILMGHAVRQNVQQDAIRKAKEALKTHRHRCIVLADYKMKIDPSQHRETSTEHYAKRGISYHGVAVCYLNAEGEFTLRYFDTVVEGDARQDIGATLAIMEEVLRRIRAVLPDNITEFCFQSDNARNYQNLALPLVLPLLASACDFFLHRILHSESQDGKCIVDAHFQKVNRQIEKYINEGVGWTEAMRKACTADQICSAIAHGGGIPATDIVVLQLDREQLDLLVARCDAVAATTKLVLPGTILDFQYRRDAAAADTAHATSISPPLSVTRTVRDHSKASRLAAHFEDPEQPLKINLNAIREVHKQHTEDYNIGQVVEQRGRGERLEYRVRWAGWDDEEATESDWLPAADLQGKRALREYEKRRQAVAAAGGAAHGEPAASPVLQPAPQGYCASGVLPMTKTKILRREESQRLQQRRKEKKRLRADAAGAEEQGQDSVDDEQEPEQQGAEQQDSESSSDDEESAPKKMDVLSRAVRFFLEEIERDECEIVTHLEQKIDQYVDGVAATARMLSFNWAARPAHGQGFGHKYLTPDTAYYAEVERLFWLGETGKKGNKSSAHQMHSLLLAKFADRYDTPSVQEITAAIGDLCKQKANGQKGPVGVAAGAAASAAAVT